VKNHPVLRLIITSLVLLVALACSSIVPAAAPPAGATVLFRENFSNNNQGWDLEPASDEYGQTTRELAGGQYVLTSTGSQDYYIVLTSIPGFEGKDFIFSMDVTVLESALADGDFSIEVSLREADGIAGRHYAFSFYNDATSYGEVWPTGNYEDLIPFWENEPNSAIRLEPGVKNTIRVEAIGSKFSVYVNDQLINTITDDTIQEAGEASINLALNTAGQTVKVAFDNLVITEP
jgi:hypothetical protein